MHWLAIHCWWHNTKPNSKTALGPFLTKFIERTLSDLTYIFLLPFVGATKSFSNQGCDSQCHHRVKKSRAQKGVDTRTSHIVCEAALQLENLLMRGRCLPNYMQLWTVSHICSWRLCLTWCNTHNEIAKSSFDMHKVRNKGKNTLNIFYPWNNKGL